MKDKMNTVAFSYDPRSAKYPDCAPFAPDATFPEYPYADTPSAIPNPVYRMVRESLIALGLDAANIGSSEWNPLRDLVKPGGKVVIKPNLVKHFHPLGLRGVESMLTHASVIRPLIDYALMAVGPDGQVIIADTPIDKADFPEVLRLTRIGDLISEYKKLYGIEILCLDLRQQRAVVDKAGKAEVTDLAGDPLGVARINLAQKSAFAELDASEQNYYTIGDRSVDHFNPASTGRGAPNLFHHQGTHDYLVCKTILNADLIINVPKMKTHKKAGITVAMKNFIGIVPGKESMPHHRPGQPPEGDAFPTPPPEKFVKRRFFIRNTARIPLVGMPIFKLARFAIRNIMRVPPPTHPIEWGDWRGNDTIWRTIVDLNKIVRYSNRNGVMQNAPQRSILNVVDGIVAVEGEGPMEGDPKHAGIIIAGESSVAVDKVSAQVMGFQPDRIPSIHRALSLSEFPLLESTADIVEIVSANGSELPCLHFKPPRGWRQHLETEQAEHAINS